MASRQDVAKLARVSEATVSRVLNGVGPVKEETRRRVLEAAERLGYQPSAIAQSFARGRSGNLGVILPHVPKVHLFSTYYFSEILSGIGDAVRAEGYDLLLLFRSPDEALDYSLLFRRQKVDALVILGARDQPFERGELARLDAGGLPFAVVGQRFGQWPYAEIDADHVAGSREAVRHLIALGRRRIAVLNGPAEYSNSRDRLHGYRQAMAEAGLDAGAPPAFAGNYSRTSGREVAPAIAAACRRGELDAVFAANDRMAIGLMQGLREAGLVPGRDLAVVGYDDSDAARVTDPPLTSVHVPFHDMGRLAAERLIARLDETPPREGAAGGRPEEPLLLPARLVVRASCGAPQAQS